MKKLRWILLGLYLLKRSGVGLRQAEAEATAD